MFWCVLLDYFIIIPDCPCGILQLYLKHKTLKTYSGWKLPACELHYVLFSFHHTLPIVTNYHITNHSHWYKKIKCQEENYLQGTRQIIWSFTIQQNWICLLVFKNRNIEGACVLPWEKHRSVAVMLYLQNYS